LLWVIHEKSWKSMGFRDISDDLCFF
jgi:hypothetical protein